MTGSDDSVHVIMTLLFCVMILVITGVLPGFASVHLGVEAANVEDGTKKEKKNNKKIIPAFTIKNIAIIEIRQQHSCTIITAFLLHCNKKNILVRNFVLCYNSTPDAKIDCYTRFSRVSLARLPSFLDSPAYFKHWFSNAICRA